MEIFKNLQKDYFENNNKSFDLSHKNYLLKLPLVLHLIQMLEKKKRLTPLFRVRRFF